MTTIGFCGLGQMGAPMAARLLDAGHDVAVWNRTAGKADPLVARGARRAASPAESASGAEAVITMLADPEAVEAVVFADDGLHRTLASGGTLIEMSTVGPDTVRRVARRLPDGVTVLDAPVLGSSPQAEAGDLKVFAAGERAEVDRRRPILETLGTVLYVGPLGAGASMKLVVNSTLGALMTALGEALVLGDALGLEQGTVLDVLADSPIGVPVRRKRQSIESGRYPATFKLSLARKDLDLVNRAASQASLQLRLARAASSWFGDAESAGLQHLDYSAVVAHIRGRPANGQGS
jgi:3-hydroxyisobutyrate dehydrogenase-like beta-hydroxyacid dehydrogenase